jgi:plasmid stabilization system protein ParE
MPIWEYIAVDNLDAADRWVAKLLDAFEAIAWMPGMGNPNRGPSASCGWLS